MGCRARRRNDRVPLAFTLVEALVAISITAIAGAALLWGIESSIQTTQYGLEQTIARGIAEQLVDEALGWAYCSDPSEPYQWPLCPNAWEAGGTARERYNDIDDFTGFTRTPPVDAWGVMLGTDNGEGGKRHANFCVGARFFDNWKEEIEVYYVSPADFSVRLANGKVSDYRAVEARVVVDSPQRGRRELAKARRVVTYVPPSG